ncbi:MAG: hypothetical protein JXM70_21135 [Pirellulales bacterium]|nr:hypothetical protein [Pirellulales bacterium]
MNKIVAVILIIAAVAAHFTFCEWYFPNELREVSQSDYERTIYFSGSSGHRRRTTFNDNVFLLAKPTSNRDEALLWGVVLPAALAGGGLLVFYSWKKFQDPSA